MFSKQLSKCAYTVNYAWDCIACAGKRRHSLIPGKKREEYTGYQTSYLKWACDRIEHIYMKINFEVYIFSTKWKNNPQQSGKGKNKA